MQKLNGNEMGLIRNETRDTVYAVFTLNIWGS